MKWRQVLDTAVEMGHKSDIRNIKEPGSYSSGYPDCRIIYGDPGTIIKHVYIAVDVGVPELLVVHEMRKQGKQIDGIISHHPTGAGVYKMAKVIELQRYNWLRHGVDLKKADSIYREMVEEEEIGFKAGNHLAVENAARLLDIPVICIHTAVDNLVQVFFENLVTAGEYDNVGHILDDVKELPECSMASSNGDGPYQVGDLEAEPGKIMVDMTGGVDPDSSIFPLLKKAGVSTLVAMHYSRDNIKAIIKNGIAAVITGHMASDSIGLNLFCDWLNKKGTGIVCGPGLYRYKRTGPGIV